MAKSPSARNTGAKVKAKPTPRAKPKAKAKPKPKAKQKPKTKQKPKAKQKPQPKAKPKAKPRSAAKPRPTIRAKSVSRPRVPRPRARATKVKASPEASARSAAASLSPTGAVVQILDAERPVEALRQFLDNITGDISVHQGQIALGAAQLALLPIAHDHRAGPEVRQLIDLVLSRWGAFPDRSGFHAQELLRNALAAVGEDRELVGQLAALVPPDAGPELRWSLACAHAVTGERGPMLRAVEAALLAGASPAQFAREPGFAAYAGDPELHALLDRVGTPQIPVDLAPHVLPVRAALDSVIKALRELGEVARLGPPATLEAVLGAERARRIQLPNDYRALLTICDGMTLWDHQFFGTLDYRGDTQLAKQARAYLEMAARANDVHDFVPIASWGPPNDWLLYDPHGRYRGGEPGLILMHEAESQPLDGLLEALAQLEALVRDALGTN